MLSQPTTKFILRTAEPNAAKWASELIGEIEIERVRETVADGRRQGKSFTLDRQIEPLVMKSEVEGLPDLHAFVKINNYVSRFSFPPMSLPKIANALEPREIPEHKMWFNPLAPEPEDVAWIEVEPEAIKPAVAASPEAPSRKPRSKPSEQPATKGAPVKEAEEIVPKLELPKVAVKTAEEEAPTLTHNL